MRGAKWLRLRIVIVSSLLPSTPVAAAHASLTPSGSILFDGVMPFALGSGDELGDIDAFWRKTIATLNPLVVYQSPDELQAYRADAVIESPCVAASQRTSLHRNATFCRLDLSIRWDETWLLELFKTVGIYAPLSVLDHEWGHHVQHLQAEQTSIDSGEQSYSLQQELQNVGFDPTDFRFVKGVAAIFHGQSVLVELNNLSPGTYGLFCLIPRTGTGEMHAALGQISRLVVGQLT